MAATTMERLTKKATTQAPLMRFRLLSGGFDQIDPAFRGIGTVELRNRVMAQRGVGDMDEVDAAGERRAVDLLSKPELLKELGAGQRFRADAFKGTQPEVLCDRDLEKKFGRHRFARINDGDLPGVTERVVERRVAVDFEEMSVDELRGFAAEEEIELPKDADNKGKIVAAIRAARRQGK